MPRKHTSKNIVIMVCLVTGLMVLALSQTLTAVMAKTIPPTAQQQVAQAIEQANISGQYRYEATIVQTYHPTLLLENVGRADRVETHTIDGEVDVPADSMTLEIRAANNPALEIKVENGRGYGRLAQPTIGQRSIWRQTSSPPVEIRWASWRPPKTYRQSTAHWRMARFRLICCPFP